ncbi:MAG: hypothetical protein CSB48_07760 [Proteobacteria bacterium]|nr:MAG: hypothetical protein CSB48_07760 [Pseudomonadota bacterium]
MAQQERRRFFRITDKVLMSYRVVGDKSNDSNESNESEQSEQSGVAGVSTGGIRHELNVLEEKLNKKMTRLRGDEPLIAEVLELFNQKINLLVGEDGKAISDSGEDDKQVMEVNMSACGIAFPSSEKISVGALLVLNLTLTLSFVNLCLSAQVVGVEERCIDSDDEAGGLSRQPWVIRADFVDISEVDQELLIQNVIKRQSEQLKALREAREKA